MQFSLPILLGWKKHNGETKEDDDSEVDTKVNITAKCLL